MLTKFRPIWIKSVNDGRLGCLSCVCVICFNKSGWLYTDITLLFSLKNLYYATFVNITLLLHCRCTFQNCFFNIIHVCLYNILAHYIHVVIAEGTLLCISEDFFAIALLVFWSNVLFFFYRVGCRILCIDYIAYNALTISIGAVIYLTIVLLYFFISCMK